MPILSLQNIIYTTLNSKIWFATAQIDSPLLALGGSWSSSSKLLAPFIPLSYPIKLCSHIFYRTTINIHNSLSARQIAQIRRQQQRKGVRLLLQSLLTNIRIADTLDDSKFPYRLKKSGYYVCFSHSGHSDIASSQPTDKVAVIISAHRAVGIDIEVQDIAWSVVQRFYHRDEIKMLIDLPMYQRNIVAKWLWQIKESFIKINQYKLAQGLGISYAVIIPKLVVCLNADDSKDSTISDIQTDYKIKILRDQFTVVVF